MSIIKGTNTKPRRRAFALVAAFALLCFVVTALLCGALGSQPASSAFADSSNFASQSSGTHSSKSGSTASKSEKSGSSSSSARSAGGSSSGGSSTSGKSASGNTASGKSASGSAAGSAAAGVATGAAAGGANGNGNAAGSTNGNASAGSGNGNGSTSGSDAGQATGGNGQAAGGNGQSAGNATGSTDGDPDADATSTNAADGDASNSDAANHDDEISLTAFSDDNEIGDYSDVSFFVLIDKQWVRVNTDGTLFEGSDTSTYKTLRIAAHDNNWGGQDRLIITGDALYKVYKNFGFTSEGFYDTSTGGNQHGYRVFANTVENKTAGETTQDYLWADGARAWYSKPNTSSYADPTYWHVPLRICSTDTKHYQRATRIYYVPNNKEGIGNSYFFDNTAGKYPNGMPVEEEGMKAANTFYCINVSDDENLVYDEGESRPATQYALVNNKASFTVKSPTAEHAWKATCGGKTLTLDGTSNGDGTITYVSEEDVTGDVTVTPEQSKVGSFDLTYNAATLSSNLTTLGTTAVARQQVVTDGTVSAGQEKNKASVSVTYDPADGKYTVLSPDNDVLDVKFAYDANGRYFKYKFAGWKVKSTGKILKAGQTLTASELKVAVGSSSKVQLDAVWKGVDAANRVSSVNFYVNTVCEVADNLTNGFVTEIGESFTKSVFTTTIQGTDGLGISSKNPGSVNVTVLAPPTREASAYETDSKLRTLTETPFTPEQSVTGASYTGDGISLGGFPSDESVLANLRSSSAKTITIDGVAVPKDRITSDNFTVRWYVLKCDRSDGWHVDGILVAKKTEFVVQKSFAGDADAVAAVKAGGFNLSVEHQETQNGVATTERDYTLSLDKKGSEASGQTGYTSYDADSDTYTWVLEGRQGRTYTVKENNYVTQDDSFHNTCLYKVSNDEDATKGWSTYQPDQGVSVSPDSVASDLPAAAYKTVAFNNVYTRAGMLNVWKVDSVSHDGIQGVIYQLKYEDGHAPNLYHRPGTSDYSTDDNAQQEGYTEQVSQIETDAQGRFSVKLAINPTTAEATYLLEETLPLGYEGANKIRVTVSDQGTVKTAAVVDSVTDASMEPEGGWLEGVGTSILTIKNVSKEYTSVRAEKKWDGVTGSGRLPVVVELCRNGVPLNEADASYRQALSYDNNWTYEWEDLPLFVDGKLAEYSLREVQIGDVSYDPSVDSDGYADYQVTAESPVYQEGANGEEHDGAYWMEGTTQHFADHVRLTIHNAQTHGLISLSKVDEKGRALAGATFVLYSDEACTDKLQSVVSNEGGQVTFEAVPSGTYYLKETNAPAGYKFDADQVYKAVVSGGTVLITKVSDNGVATQAGITSITNTFGATLKVQKRDGEGKPLANAQFGLYRVNDGINITPTTEIPEDMSGFTQFGDLFVTDENGEGLFATDLSDGTYCLVETKAPNGFCSLHTQAVVKVDAGQVSVTLPDDGKWDYSDTSQGSKTCTFTVTNDILYDLPSTGGVGIAATTAAATALMLIALLGLSLRRVVESLRRKSAVAFGGRLGGGRRG